MSAAGCASPAQQRHAWSHASSAMHGLGGPDTNAQSTLCAPSLACCRQPSIRSTGIWLVDIAAQQCPMTQMRRLRCAPARREHCSMHALLSSVLAGYTREAVTEKATLAEGTCEGPQVGWGQVVIWAEQARRRADKWAWRGKEALRKGQNSWRGESSASEGFGSLGRAAGVREGVLGVLQLLQQARELAQDGQSH